MTMTTMRVLGSIQSSIIIVFTVVAMLFTLISCYILAVRGNHVQPWLPTISACSVYPPETYLFRYGILTGALLLLVFSLCIYVGEFPYSHDIVNVTIGVIAALCLGVVAVVNPPMVVEDCDPPKGDYIILMVHIGAALIFFILEAVLLCRITKAGHSSPNKTLVNIRIASTVMLWLHNIIRILHMANFTVNLGNFPIFEFTEWVYVLVIIVYYFTLASDFAPYYIAFGAKELKKE